MGSQYSFDAENLDIKDEIINIYTQYVDDILQTGKRCDEFVEYKENHIAFTDKDVKPIAFYLPQFYTFPENDEWWGKGFTEWTNVTKSMPRFLGHYQPHLPYDSTFYDLNNVEILKGQVSLAKNYGIYGFCFHYYWFSGKRLLEKPLNNFLKTKEGLDFPFCISWANENWSRRWDGSDQEILMAQKHSDEDDLACIADICQYVRDERYIRIKGKPLIIIYNASLLPDANKTIKIWRDYCKENGIGDICLAGAQTNPTKDPLVYDFDEAVEFPPHYYWLAASNITQKMTPITDKHGLSIYDMEEYIEQKRHYSIQPEKIYKSIFPNWDNTPRKGTNGIVFQMNPQLYKKWLLDIINYTKENRESGDRFIFINAWNEWAEGAHLEPDRKYGYANLQATADAICELRE
ncbi:MAG: glycoside hydrolase family 99-like domain-containing protein [Clostridiales bacterium]|nr:glycoside hydrolase family 99-like domain-containing protein [Clostridiales bacterium]